ncbi:MAG: ThiF family adenylyltransferase [Verrucomicrobiota bacterium]
MTVKTNLRLTEEQWTKLRRLLFSGDGREMAVLCLCGTRFDADRQIYCVHEIVEIPLDTCIQRKPNAVRWNVQALLPVLERALKRRLWVFKIHSHPENSARFSAQDDETDIALGNGVEQILGRSPGILSAFMLPDGKIYGRLVDSTGFTSIDQVVVLGDTVGFMHRESAGVADEAYLRTRQAFGDGTTNLVRSLSVGVAGCSGTGSWVVEMLGRLGVGRLVLVDPDSIERKNLNRIVDSSLKDLGRPKVEVLADAVRAVGLVAKVETYAQDLAHTDVVKALAGCDFLFGCMDSADGRETLNRIASFYLIPYIDVGVRLDADGRGSVEQICCAVHYLMPGGSSLLSRGVITPEQVQAQALCRTHPEQYASLRKEGYIKGISVDRPAVISINGFIATHAVNEMLARLHPFRRDPNNEFRYQVFSLPDGAWLRLADGPSCKLLGRYVGRGDAQPLLGNPSLS